MVVRVVYAVQLFSWYFKGGGENSEYDFLN